MATLTKRRWTYTGQERLAYRVSYEGSLGKRRHEQLSKRGKALEFKKTCDGTGSGPKESTAHPGEHARILVPARYGVKVA